MATWKDAVRLATTANLDLEAAQTVTDGIALALNDKVLIKDQTDPIQNGLYVFGGPPLNLLTRSTDTMDPELMVRVSEGNTNAHTQWALVTKAPIRIGTTPLHFSPQTLVFNVKDFGAVGDGVTDDLPAFLACQAAMAAHTLNQQRSSIFYVPPVPYPKSYFLNSDFDIVTPGRYQGVGVGGGNGGSRLTFAPGKGIRVWKWTASPRLLGDATDCIVSGFDIFFPQALTLGSWQPRHRFAVGDKIRVNCASGVDAASVGNGSWIVYYECIITGKSSAGAEPDFWTAGCQNPDTSVPWTANTRRKFGSLVRASDPLRWAEFFSATAPSPTNFGRTGETEPKSVTTRWTDSTSETLNNLIVPTHANWNGHCYKATRIGAPPHRTGAREPIWPTTPGGTVTDKNITWTENGPAWGLQGVDTPWTARTSEALNNLIVPTHDNWNGHCYKATSIGAPPHRTGAKQPIWPTTPGATVPDENITWTENGPAGETTTDGTMVWTWAPSTPDNIIKDGDAVFACRTAAAIFADTTCTIERNYVEGCPGPGIHLVGNGISWPASNVNRARINFNFLVNNDVGIASYGGDTNAMIGYGNHVGGGAKGNPLWQARHRYTTVGQRVRSTTALLGPQQFIDFVVTTPGRSGEAPPAWIYALNATTPDNEVVWTGVPCNPNYGYFDRGYLGNRWFGCMSEECAGPGFALLSTAGTGATFGCYSENTVPDVYHGHSTMGGGNPNSGTKHSGDGFGWDAHGVWNLRTNPIPVGAGVNAHFYANDPHQIIGWDSDDDDGRWYGLQYDLPDVGWWGFVYSDGTTTALAVSGNRAREGKALVWAPKGILLGPRFSNAIITTGVHDPMRDDPPLTWRRGDIVINVGVSGAGQISYWQCVAAGTPGMWVAHVL